MEHSQTAVQPSIKIPINKTTCILFYISKNMNIDFPTLYSIYKDVGVSIFKLFFMCAGKKISFPKEDKLLSWIQESEEIYNKVTINPKKKIERVKTTEVYQEFIDLLDNDSMNIII